MSTTGQRIGIRELRNNSKRWVQRAAAGERIVITTNGEPIAQLGPLVATGPNPTLDDLAARGLIQRARRKPDPKPAVTIPPWAGNRMDQVLREVRGR